MKKSTLSLFLFVSLILLNTQSIYAFELSSSDWLVKINPHTLAVSAIPLHENTVILSEPVLSDEIQMLRLLSDSASWRLKKSGLQIEAKLSDNDFSLNFISGGAGRLTWPIVPLSSTKGMMLPLSEGIYVSAEDKAWRSALLHEYNSIDSTQDLSLPLLGFNFGSYTLGLILANPFNNIIHFSSNQFGLTAAVTHHFTTLDHQPYTVLFHLDSADLLAPAKRYRTWLQENNQFVPLKTKLAKLPDGQKLIGASHVYLWGQDISAETIKQLQEANLTRLWLGLPQWEVGFHHPEAVQAARDAGYLIAPYDSYDTALPVDVNPSWSSAHLGESAYKQCGILLENGKRKTGFQNQGVYTNAICIRPILEKRVTFIQSHSGYNSWFLDVDASGMLFDDYDPAHKNSQREDAANRLSNMYWITHTLKIPLGSEDGNAVVNQAIVFAHGMETPGFGWQDDDMHKNARSPYFLGRWWPENRPGFFFKPTFVKPKYQQLYFNPAKRLPLYQTVFHDSVITSNHWTIDNLKFKNAQIDITLLQQLYNVPPLINLNLPADKKRLFWIKAVDVFFSPLHERLAFQALVDFKWLTADHLVQKTQFSDGTQIIANFTNKPFLWNASIIASYSVVALIPGNKTAPPSLHGNRLLQTEPL